MKSAPFIPALLAIAFASAPIAAHAQVETRASSSGASVRVAKSSSKETRVEWTADSFGANVYASKTAAARALADDWGKTVSGMRQKDPKVVIIGGSGKLPEQAYHAMIEVLRGHFPTSEIKYERGLPESSALPSPSAEPVTGYVRYMPTTPGNALLFLAHSSTTLVDKPWVDDFESFANAQPAKKYVTGRSRNPETDALDAEDDARASAATNLVTVLRPWIQRWGMSDYVRDDRRLAERIEEVLEDSRHADVITDRFAQRFQRPYGDVHRHAILIDASDSNLDLLGREIAMQVKHERSWMKRTVGSAAAILAFVYVLYLLVNALTKGYFTWKLRALAAVAGAGLVALLLVAA